MYTLPQERYDITGHKINMNDLIEKINFLKNNFPTNSIVMRGSSKTFYKVVDYQYMAKDDLL